MIIKLPYDCGGTKRIKDGRKQEMNHQQRSRSVLTSSMKHCLTSLLTSRPLSSSIFIIFDFIFRCFRKTSLKLSFTNSNSWIISSVLLDWGRMLLMCLLWALVSYILPFRLSNTGLSLERMAGSYFWWDIIWVAPMVSDRMWVDLLNRLFCSLRRMVVVWERISPVFILRYSVRATTRKLLRMTPKMAMKPARNLPMGVMGEYQPQPMEVMVMKVNQRQVEQSSKPVLEVRTDWLRQQRLPSVTLKPIPKMNQNTREMTVVKASGYYCWMHLRLKNQVWLMLLQVQSRTARGEEYIDMATRALKTRYILAIMSTLSTSLTQQTKFRCWFQSQLEYCTPCRYLKGWGRIVRIYSSREPIIHLFFTSLQRMLLQVSLWVPFVQMRCWSISNCSSTILRMTTSRTSMQVVQLMTVMREVDTSPEGNRQSASILIIPKNMVSRARTNIFFQTSSSWWCVNLLIRVSSISDNFDILRSIFYLHSASLSSWGSISSGKRVGSCPPSWALITDRRVVLDSTLFPTCLNFIFEALLSSLTPFIYYIL